jgi:DNA polymerase-1
LILAFDVEADDLLLDATRIWCVCVHEIGGQNRRWAFREDSLGECVDLLNSADRLVAHNGVGYDRPVMERLLRRPLTTRIIDTLVLSRLLYPDRTNHPAGGHSLAAWGEYLGMPKLDHKEFHEWSPEMETYCHRDVEITVKLFRFIRDSAMTCREAVAVEHDVAEIITRQYTNGVGFDSSTAVVLVMQLNRDLDEIKGDLAKAFPSVPVQMKTKVKWIPFNPGSRKQIAERLSLLGWEPELFTPTGQPVIDESVLAGINLREARLLEKYLLIQKRLGQLDNWLDCARGDKIHGEVNTNGAVTGRMTHSNPNTAQVPGVKSPYGKEFRSLFRPSRTGWVQIGCDASGLELRMFGSFLAEFDGGEYVKVLLNGDIHSHTQKLIGAPSRDQTKTFTYATLYGAGPGNIAKLMGVSVKEARRLMDLFGSGLKVDQLMNRIKVDMRKGHLTGIDGRPLPVRSEHSALNTLLQSAGAVVMKYALILSAKHPAFKEGRAAFMLNVHDEFQIECEPDIADEIGKHCVDSIRLAGERFNLACPLTGEYKIGNNWAETH